MVPPKAARFFNRRTISRDLTLSLALMTALVLSVFGVSYQIYYTNQEIVDLQAEAAAVADEFAGVLARPIWNMDVDTVTQITRAYLSSDFLTGVRVYTSLDVYFDNIPDHPRADRWIVSEREIVHAGEIIGSVVLLFSKARIETIRTRSFVLTLVTIVLVTTVIGFGTHQLMKRLVADPLNRLITGIRTIAAGDYQLSLPAEKRSDINTLILEINIMAREIDRRESDLNKLRETLKNIVDSMPSVLVGVDPEGRVTQWNREAEMFTGIAATQAMGRNIEAVYPSLAEAMKKADRAIQEKRPHKEGKVSSRVDGEIRFSDITVYPLTTSRTGGAVIRVDDITDRVRIEEMMVQSEKMLSVGGLAAGMAHEINNPLAGILQCTQVMQNRLSGDLPKNREVAERCGISMAALHSYMQRRHMPEMMASIMESGKRAARIVENMLSFSRKSEATTTLNDLSQLMEDTLELAENDYDLKKRYDFRRIQIVRQYDSRVPAVPCEATGIQQVLLNILKNGAQAMAINAGISPPRLVLGINMDGAMVRMEIEDNGPGMEEAVCKRVFEPFFTTKSVGVGTGLGLSVSYFIITENHGGTLTVSSTPGSGSRFVIRLPLSRDGAAA
jgi:PAS domain S-box-containing protein